MRIFSFINNSYEVLNENFYPILRLKVCQRCDLFRLELIEIKDICDFNFSSSHIKM